MATFLVSSRLHPIPYNQFPTQIEIKNVTDKETTNYGYKAEKEKNKK